MISAGEVTVRRIVAGPWEENCYVVSAGRDAVVVDPGGEADAIAAHIAASRLRPHAVLITHGHHDHLGALGEIVETYGVPFGVHSAEARVLKHVNLSRFACHGLPPIELPPIGIDLEPVADLRFGDLEIGVVHTPGHSPGSVCLEVAGDLLTGDTLLASGVARTDMPGADQATLDASVRRLTREYPPDTLIRPGHGEPCRLGDAVAGVGAMPGSQA